MLALLWLASVDVAMARVKAVGTSAGLEADMGETNDSQGAVIRSCPLDRPVEMLHCEKLLANIRDCL